MPSIDGSVMYSFCVPPVGAVLAPPPSAALAADVCNGPLQPKSASAIRIVASLPQQPVADANDYPHEQIGRKDSQPGGHPLERSSHRSDGFGQVRPRPDLGAK